MSLHQPQLSSLVELLRTRAAEQPEQVAYTYLVDGEGLELSISYAELDRQARAIAAVLQQSGARHQRAVLLYPPDLTYLSAFFGCLYAGIIAVPAYPPDPGRLARTLPRLQAIIADCRAEIVLTTTEILSMAQFLFAQAPDLEHKHWVATDALPLSTEDGWKSSAIGADDVAFLQYTSGSTGTPKGVILSHGNLLHNLGLISDAFEIDEHSVGVSWLPPYHDMGLIGGILAPMYRARPTVLMSPVAFLQRPFRWLKAISRQRATISGGPNFAYEMCIRKVSAEEREELDLSNWSVAFSGAEPVRASTLRRFAEVFAPSGFHQRAFLPCYGLAEATLIVTSAPKSSEAVVSQLDAKALQHDRAVGADSLSEDVATRVSCGLVVGDQEIAIVRAESGTEADPGDIGEVWVRGASVARGYWRREEESNHTFGAMVGEPPRGPFLRTGDVGFLRAGQLFVTGRLKDLIILRGRNHYPQDIEQTAEESHPSLRRGCCAAFGIEMGTEERVVLAIEVERRHHDRRRARSSPPGADRRGPDRRADDVNVVEHVAMAPFASVGAEGAAAFDSDALCDAIRAAVQAKHDLHVHDVLLLRPGTLPKTSSGKVQRRECRNSYLNGTLEPVVSSVLRTEQHRNTSALLELTPAFAALNPEERLAWLQDLLMQQIGRTLGVARERIAVHTVVSSLGLDSLMATELSHRLERSLHVELPSTAFLRDSTIGEVGAQLERLVVETRAEASGVPSGVEDGALSVGQQALWHLHDLAPHSSAYNVSCTMRIVSTVDIDGLRAAFHRLVESHPILRTTYQVRDGRPTQRAQRENLLEFQHVEMEADELDAAVQTTMERPFDLTAGPILRVSVFTRDVAEHVMVVTVHHIAADLWSLVLMLGDLRSFYQAGTQAIEAAPRSSVQYGDFVRWQRAYLSSETGERDRTYWVERLANASSALDLPADRVRAPMQTFRGAEIRLSVARATASRLREIVVAEGTTMYVGLLTAFGVMLSRFSGQKEIDIGSPSLGRSRAQFESVVGYFVNPLVIRADLTGDPSFTTLLGRVRATVLDALEHQNYPFLRLVEQLKVPHDPSRSPLFQAMFVFEKPHTEAAREVAEVILGVPGSKAALGPLAIESYPAKRRSSQFDLTLEAMEVGEEVALVFQYNTDLFDEATAEAMAGHFVTVLSEMVQASDTPVTRLPLLSGSDRQRVVVDWNSSDQAFQESCIHHMVSAQVARTPDAVAVVAGEAALTYRELDARADLVARRLGGLGIDLEAPVAVCLERGCALVVVLLGILKAGAMFVPIDPRYPRERQAFLLEDSGARWLITEPSLESSLPQSSAKVLQISDLIGASGMRSVPRCPPVAPRTAAYVIYTSGSTGRPKGVCIEHRSAAAMLQWASSAFGVENLRGVLAATSVCFDLSVFETFAPLVCGGTVVLAPDVLSLGSLPAADRVTLVNTVPSAMAELLRLGPLPRSVRTVNLAGEALSTSLVDQIYASGTVERVFDLYGPSEDTTYSTWTHRKPGARPSIGRSLPGSQAYVMSTQLEPVPPRIIGELALGGVGVARGYLRRPASTAERFIPDMFGGERLYLTGDLARRRGDGELEFHGRQDHQVKLRGFRIELGEVEAALRSLPGVDEVVVIVREHRPGDTRLAAYVVGQPSLESSVLRESLRSRLPGFMVPSEVIVLQEMPRTPNGKLDRRALPAPQTTPDARTAPRNALEQVLVKLAGEVLGVEGVGIDDNFFELGGHSLLATRFASAIRDALGLSVPLAMIFEAPAVIDLARALRAGPDGAIAEEAADLLLAVAEMSEDDARDLLGESSAPLRSVGGGGDA